MKEPLEQKSCTTLDRAHMEQQIIEQLRGVFDPEIPVNIYDLGLIYNVKVSEDYVAHLIMTLTAPNCPAAEILPMDAEDAARRVDGIKDAVVELTFEPTWTKDCMTDAAKLELGLL